MDFTDNRIAEFMAVDTNRYRWDECAAKCVQASGIGCNVCCAPVQQHFIGLGADDYGIRTQNVRLAALFSQRGYACKIKRSCAQNDRVGLPVRGVCQYRMKFVGTALRIKLNAISFGSGLLFIGQLICTVDMDDGFKTTLAENLYCLAEVSVEAQ